MNASGNVTSGDDPDISREKLISGALLCTKSARCFDTDLCAWQPWVNMSGLSDDNLTCDKMLNCSTYCRYKYVPLHEHY
jgi:hypothetical protein